MPAPIRNRRLDAARDYILRDEFDGQRAAGGVNNTAAEPGPGTRDVRDTGNGLSISGGLLRVASGIGAWSDPGISWAEGIARTAGRLFIAEVTQTGGSRMGLGWLSNPAVETGTGIWENAYYSTATTNVRAVGDAATPDIVLGRTASTSYQYCIVLRAAGAYYYIKGGSEYPWWSLVWIQSTENIATLYPALFNYDGIYTSDYLRVPRELWLPTPAAYDTFTRANGALGNSEVAGPDGQQVAARAWTNQVGTTLVAGNAAQASALVGGIAIATVDTGHLNVVLSSTLTRSGNEIGVVLRYADSSNYIRAYHDGTNVKLDKIVGGGVTNVISAAQAYAAGAAIVVICNGTSFSLYYNNTQIGATSTVADAALQTGTLQGTYSTNTGNTQDNFQVFPRGTGGEYEYLNNF